MKLRLLPSTFERDGSASPRQHLTCFVLNDSVAFDAGSLAMAITEANRDKIRDVVLTHAHLDHIAGLPLFIDDQFSTLTKPIRIYAAQDVIDVLERDIFNWSVYPRFSELRNEFGAVVEYCPIENGKPFDVGSLAVFPVAVDHKVPSSGFLISDESSTIALTGDTAGLNDFWDVVTDEHNLKTLLVECAFPNELEDLARSSYHMTPKVLEEELKKFDWPECQIYAINIKPAYRDQVIGQIADLKISNLSVLEVGREYIW